VLCPSCSRAHPVCAAAQGARRLALPERADLCRQVARALVAEPELFPDHSGPALQGRQDRADDWRTLIAQLEVLLQRARDTT